MSDILTKYTEERNRQCGRKGYCGWKREKEDVISPRNYGCFIQRKRKRG
jgi:hypothetical protein